jgi:hypothetical protein
VKKILFCVLILVFIAVFVMPAGAVFADQAYHSERLPFHSVNLSGYPLNSGFMMNIHMNGPNNFEKKEFQLNGAKPDTEFFIYRVFAATVFNPLDPIKVLIPNGFRMNSGTTIMTDKNGNGHCQLKLSPENLTAVREVCTLVMKVVLYEVKPSSPLPSVPDDGVRAYETEVFTGSLDWKW